MKDYIVRAIAYDANVRAFAITAKHTVETALILHGLNPLTAILLGRGLMATSILNAMNKGEKDVVTLQVVGDGKMGGITCIANKKGVLKGYVKNNDYESYKEEAIYGIGACIGKGFLNIVKDLGLKHPYIGNVPLQSGEIGDDLAYYFTYSEQIPSMVALGVKLNKDRTVKSATGVVIQLMPGANNNIINEIEEKIRNMHSATALLEKVKTPEKMLEFLLGENELVITQIDNINYKCNCSTEKMQRGIISLGKEQLKEIINEQEKIETICHFCNKKYIFDSKEIEIIIKDI